VLKVSFLAFLAIQIPPIIVYLLFVLYILRAEFDCFLSTIEQETMMMDTDKTECSFPYRVYHMLEEAPKAGFDDVVSWLPDGSGFAVHNQDEFVKRIVGMFFTHTKWKSFLKQLNLYNFHRLSKRRGPGRDCCYYGHPFLIRGDIMKCNRIQRSKGRGGGQGSIPSSKDGDLYLSLASSSQNEEEELTNCLSRRSTWLAKQQLQPALLLANEEDAGKKNMGAGEYQHVSGMLPAVAGSGFHGDSTMRIQQEPTNNISIITPPRRALEEVTSFNTIDESCLDDIMIVGTRMAGQQIGGGSANNNSNFTPDMADAIVSLFGGGAL
jgi:hypothetical protein